MKTSLKPRQILFCKLYTQNTVLFGNATESYAEAYKYNLDKLSRLNKKDKAGKDILNSSEWKKAYDVCSSNAYKLLRNAEIQKTLTKFLNQLLKDDIVDRELVRVIMQDAELVSKIAAIREYNKLKQRIVEKSELKVKFPQPIYGSKSTK